MRNSHVDHLSTNVTPNWAIHALIVFKLSKDNPVTSVGSTWDHTVEKKNFWQNFLQLDSYLYNPSISLPKKAFLQKPLEPLFFQANF